MSNKEMDMAIAEAVGWKPTVDGGICWDGEGNAIITPPAYSADLNAMREAEQRLFTRHHYARDIFIDRLCRIMDPVNGYRKQSAIDIIDATAEQHARALVETIKQIKP